MKEPPASEPAKTSGPPPPKRRIWLRRFAYSLVATLLLLVTTYFGLWWWAKSGRDAEIAKIRAAGEPVWFHELRRPPIHPKNDGAPLLREAIAAMEPLPDDLLERLYENSQPNRDWEATQISTTSDLADVLDDEEEFAGDPAFDEEVPPPTAPEPSLTWRERELEFVADLEPHLTANRETFKRLDEALARPDFSYDHDYDARLPGLMPTDKPELQSTVNFELNRLLEARWRAELSAGRIDEAFATIRTRLLLRRLLLNDPTPFNAMLGIVLPVHDLKVLEETLSRASPSDQSFSAMDRVLAHYERSISCADYLRKNRASDLTMQENVAYIAVDERGTLSRLESPQFYWRIRQPFAYLSQRNVLERLAAIIPSADRGDAEARALRDSFAAEWDAKKEPQLLDRLVVPTMFQIVARDAINTRHKLTSARIAMRVTRFRAAHGKNPSGLNDVLDEHLQKIPVDLHGGKEFRYRRLKNGFIVYPIGADDIDGRGYDIETEIVVPGQRDQEDEGSYESSFSNNNDETFGRFRVRYE